MTKLVRQVHDPRRLERRDEPKPCGMRCTNHPVRPAETTKHRKCMLAKDPRNLGACAHALFKQ